MTIAKKNQSRTDRVAADQAMIDGTTANQAKLPGSFPLGSKTITPPEVIQVYEQRLVTARAAVAAEAARAAAVKADQDMRAQTRGVTLEYKRLILAMFAGSPDVLGTFGLKQTRPTPPSAATKAAAAAKAKATRKGAKAPAPAPAPQGTPVAAPPASAATAATAAGSAKSPS
jgi:hypothetical protein